MIYIYNKYYIYIIYNLYSVDKKKTTKNPYYSSRMKFEDTYFLRLLVYIIFAPPAPPGPKTFQTKWPKKKLHPKSLGFRSQGPCKP